MTSTLKKIKLCSMKKMMDLVVSGRVGRILLLDGKPELELRPEWRDRISPLGEEYSHHA